MTITSIPLSHPNQGVGYKFQEDGKSFVFLTDNELTYRHHGGLRFEDYRRFSANADLLIHDAELTEKEYKTKKSWGHTVYKDALRLALEAGSRSSGCIIIIRKDPMRRWTPSSKTVIKSSKSNADHWNVSQSPGYGDCFITCKKQKGVCEFHEDQ